MQIAVCTSQLENSQTTVDHPGHHFVDEKLDRLDDLEKVHSRFPSPHVRAALTEPSRGVSGNVKAIHRGVEVDQAF
jgi:hypothetical protein